MRKEKSPTPKGTELGDLVLPEKDKVGRILTELHRKVNPCEVSDLVLKPFHEILGMMIAGRK